MYQYTLAPIESVLETIFIILSGITNSYLLGLVLLAVVVRLATKPLEKYANRAVTTQAETESVLAPQIEAIKLKYPVLNFRYGRPKQISDLLDI